MKTGLILAFSALALLAAPLRAQASFCEKEGKRVLVVGAGVAGLTLAQQLKQKGFTPTIVEQGSSLRTGGYKIDIRGVALDVVKKMGVYDELCARRTDFDEVCLLDADGKELTRVDIDVSGSRYEEDIEIMRGDLCMVLMEGCDGIECLFGNSPVRLSQEEDGVLVEFEHGQPRLFDLVVGADGLHSRVRQCGFAEQAQVVRPLGIYVSVFPINNYENAPEHELEFFLPGRWVNVYSSLDGSVTRACFAFQSEPLLFDRADLDTQRKLLCEAFAEASPEVQDLLAHVGQTQDFYFDGAAQVYMPRWSKGRVALVGDAAFAPSPLSGQGTSIALVGAYVLAEELAASGADYSAAFERYELRLRDYVGKNQELVEFSLAAMGAKPDSWETAFFQFMFENAPREDWARLLKQFGTQRVHEAANCLKLADAD